MKSEVNTLDTNRGCLSGRDEALQQERAASIPGVVGAASGIQPAPAFFSAVVQRLDLLCA